MLKKSNTSEKKTNSVEVIGEIESVLREKKYINSASSESALSNHCSGIEFTDIPISIEAYQLLEKLKEILILKDESLVIENNDESWFHMIQQGNDSFGEVGCDLEFNEKILELEIQRLAIEENEELLKYEKLVKLINEENEELIKLSRQDILLSNMKNEIAEDLSRKSKSIEESFFEKDITPLCDSINSKYNKLISAFNLDISKSKLLFSTSSYAEFIHHKLSESEADELLSTIILASENSRQSLNENSGIKSTEFKGNQMLVDCRKAAENLIRQEYLLQISSKKTWLIKNIAAKKIGLEEINNAKNDTELSIKSKLITLKKHDLFNNVIEINWESLEDSKIRMTTIIDSYIELELIRSIASFIGKGVKHLNFSNLNLSFEALQSVFSHLEIQFQKFFMAQLNNQQCLRNCIMHAKAMLISRISLNIIEQLISQNKKFTQLAYDNILQLINLYYSFSQSQGQNHFKNYFSSEATKEKIVPDSKDDIVSMIISILELMEKDELNDKYCSVISKTARIHQLTEILSKYQLHFSEFDNSSCLEANFTTTLKELIDLLTFHYKTINYCSALTIDFDHHTLSPFKSAEIVQDCLYDSKEVVYSITASAQDLI